MLKPKDLKEVKQAGTYQVYLEADENGATGGTVAKVTLTFPYTVLNEVNGEGIDASDFEYTDETLEEMPGAELLERAGAHAWRLEDGEAVPVIDVKIYGQEQNATKISFATQKGTKVTVRALKTKRELFQEQEFLYSYLENTEYPFQGSSYQFGKFSALLVLLLISPVLLSIVAHRMLEKGVKELRELLEKT